MVLESRSERNCEENKFYSHRKSNPGYSARHFTDRAITAPLNVAESWLLNVLLHIIWICDGDKPAVCNEISIPLNVNLTSDMKSRSTKNKVKQHKRLYSHTTQQNEGVPCILLDCCNWPVHFISFLEGRSKRGKTCSELEHLHIFSKCDFYSFVYPTGYYVYIAMIKIYYTKNSFQLTLLIEIKAIHQWILYLKPEKNTNEIKDATWLRFWRWPNCKSNPLKHIHIS
jgi:hypothetical protein